MHTEPFPTIIPRYSTCRWLKWHFSGLRNSPSLCSLARCSSTHHSCSSSVPSVWTTISSIYTEVSPLSISSLRSSSIMVWNVAGEFVNPKNITVGSNRPSLVLKAAFHSSPSLMCTLLYPHLTSSFVNHCFPDILWISSDMRGRGYLLGIVHLLRFQ